MPAAVTELTNRQRIAILWAKCQDDLHEIMDLLGHTEAEGGIPDAEAAPAYTALNAALEALSNGRPRSR